MFGKINSYLSSFWGKAKNLASGVASRVQQGLGKVASVYKQINSNPLGHAIIKNIPIVSEIADDIQGIGAMIKLATG